MPVLVCDDGDRDAGSQQWKRPSPVPGSCPRSLLLSSEFLSSHSSAGNIERAIGLGSQARCTLPGLVKPFPSAVSCSAVARHSEQGHLLISNSSAYSLPASAVKGWMLHRAQAVSCTGSFNIWWFCSEESTSAPYSATGAQHSDTNRYLNGVEESTVMVSSFFSLIH